MRNTLYAALVVVATLSAPPLSNAAEITLSEAFDYNAFIQEMVDARKITTVSLGETTQFVIISCLLASDDPDRVKVTSINADVDKLSAI